MKKLIYLTTIFTILVSLTFIPAIQINAASKINITYYAGNGYFKAKPNRNKNKITIKNKLNKKRGYAPAIRRDGYTFDGWYTKKKGGKKYSASTIITKKQKLYPHWIKKYKINTNYFVPMGLSFDNLDEFQKYYGSMTVLKKNIKKVEEMIEKWDAFPLLYLKDVLILLRQFHIVIVYAPVAQGIEHRPPEAGAAVRIRPGVYFFCYF